MNTSPDSDAVAAARIQLEQDRLNGEFNVVWMIAAKIQQGLEAGWEWADLDARLSLGSWERTNVNSPSARQEEWLQRMGEQPAVVTAARQLLEAGTVRLVRGKDWEIITAEDTQIVVKMSKSVCWMRRPAVRADEHGNRVVKSAPNDGRWQRLSRLEPYGFIRREPAARGPYVEIGVPLKIYRGMGDWWRTSEVISVRELERHEVPIESKRRTR